MVALHVYMLVLSEILPIPQDIEACITVANPLCTRKKHGKTVFQTEGKYRIEYRKMRLHGT